MNTQQQEALNDWQRQFVESVMGGEPQCSGCAHANADNTCKAYPDGIPLEIVSGEHDHTEPYPGDNGMRYKVKAEDA